MHIPLVCAREVVSDRLSLFIILETTSSVRTTKVLSMTLERVAQVPDMDFLVGCAHQSVATRRPVTFFPITVFFFSFHDPSIG